MFIGWEGDLPVQSVSQPTNNCNYSIHAPTRYDDFLDAASML